MAEMAEMAENQESQLPPTTEPAAPEAKAVADGQPATENNEEATEGEAEVLFPLTINLPHEPSKIHIMVSPQEQIHELRQSVMELPSAFQYSCFHFEHAGERINDFVQISDVKGLGPESEVRLVEDPYTEKEARIHVIRIRDLVAATGDRTDTLHGAFAGNSLFDSVNTDTKDVDNAQASAYDFDAAAKISTLLPKAEEPAPKTVKSVALSPWNPPPYHLRQKGHLLYLLVTTNEGEQYQITSHIGGFFVNKSSNSKFDPSPRPAPKAQSAHSLFTLLGQISPSFSASFEQLLQFNNRREPLSTFQMTNAIPAAPWLLPPQSSPLCAHSADITRTQEGYLIAGVDNTDTLRDWNEEFQAARELPKETVQDRVFRERFISKLFADYTDAAARGAILVARGEVTPLNPTEERDAQIFVYNNVFFSFGADGVGTFTTEGGDDAARVATGKDVNGVRLVNQLDIDGLYSPATVVVDYLGKRIVGQTVVPGIFKQREPGENSIDYGAVEGKDIVADDERFAAPFAKLSQALRVKKHAVWDKDGKRFDLEASVETKGLMGTDGRKYVLDLYRITPLDILWLEENDVKTEDGSEYPHRMTVLRPELVESFRTSKWTVWVNAELARIKERSEKEKSENPDSDESKEQKDSENAALEEKLNGLDFTFGLNPDVFSGQVPQTDKEKEEMAADESDVRAACEHLRRDVIPDFVGDIKSSDLPFPMDGSSLTKMMHKRGINVRYLGTIASSCEGPRLLLLKSLCQQEAISRAFKHVAGKYLRYLPMPLTSACIAHLLNCLLGSGFNSNPVVDIDESLKSLYPEADLAFAQLTPESLRKEIEAQSIRRFKLSLDADWHTGIKHLQLLREVSLKLGFQLQAKEFQFTGEASNVPSTANASTVNGHTNGDGEKSEKSEKSKKKKKKAREGSPASTTSASTPQTTFTVDDIVNVVPIIKDSAPKSTISEEALEGGRHSIVQGNRKIGQELLLESLTLHEQIYGILHSEVARAYSSLAQTYYHLEEKEAAVDLARKAVVVSERTVGVDSAETLLYYLNLGLYLHGLGDSKSALAYVKHALDLWKVIFGPDHPDSITTLNNGAVMLQYMQAYHESRVWFEQALAVCDRVMGAQSLQAASLLFQLAQALALDNEPKAALTKMRDSYNIFLHELGPENNNTKEAETWLEQLTQNAVAIAKRDKDAQGRRLRAGIRFPTRNLGGATAQPTASPALNTQQSSKPDARSIDELLKFIEGTSGQSKTIKKRPGRGGLKTRVNAASSSS